MSKKYHVGRRLIVVGFNKTSFGIGFSVERSLIFLELGFLYIGVEL